MMIILTIVRIAGEFELHTTDIQWETFWQQMEASTAIIAISVTGFRTLLAVRARKEREEYDHRRERLQSYRQRLLRKAVHRDRAEQSTDLDNLPSIPGATVVGMRTFITGRGRNYVSINGTSIDHQTGHGKETVDGSDYESRRSKDRSMSSAQVRREHTARNLA